MHTVHTYVPISQILNVLNYTYVDRRQMCYEIVKQMSPLGVKLSANY
jgi:hypothetical protein